MTFLKRVRESFLVKRFKFTFIYEFLFLLCSDVETQDKVLVSKLISRPIFVTRGLEGFRCRLGL